MKRADNRHHLKPFKKGHDKRRNLKGAPKKLPALDTLLPEVLGDEADEKSKIRKILEALAKRAVSKYGDRAAEILLDRAYGKAKQSIEHSGSVVNPEIIIKINDTKQ